ncbi:uncharacterized protein K02A2.6-like [Amphibalanus amphitrite]|uniref:uncharacterized protein K02A2.6-like n=1 Tax=Amphibalanus amphitrite TaxID=1232801 RepID=UPI001C8FABA7|nr:uncharacterized protein K02A2.6-like [Amphibalanus amphitrite]
MPSRHEHRPGRQLLQQISPLVLLDLLCLLLSQSGVSSQTAEPAHRDSVSSPISGYQHEVTIDPTIPPVRQGLRRLPLSVRDEVSARLRELESQGVIERIHASSWVSPIVVGKKRNGSIRICVDMRQVNRAVITDAYPIPHMDDVLSRLHGSAVYSVFDLKDAYHQVELHPRSQDLTAFITHEGLFRYVRCPFGLASSGPAFQGIMNDMLRGIDGVEVYLDDVVVHAATQVEHDRRVAQVLEVFRRHNVQVNHAKCVQSARSIHFLGFIVSQGRVELDPERLAPLTEAPEPDSAAKLQSFLGAVGFYSKFVPQFSTMVEPLRRAVQREPFEWSTDLSRLVSEVKQAVIRSPSLALFDPSLPTVVTTDASDVGLGAYISQFKGREERVVAYASRSLSAAERSYSTVEKEALCCVWAVEKWHTFLWGRRFLLRTDNQALCTIFGPKGSTRAGRRIARWEARLLAYSFDTEYVRSAQNGVADGLSRLPVRDSEWEDDDSIEIAALYSDNGAPNAISESEWRQYSADDSTFQLLRGHIQSGRWPRRCSAEPELQPYFSVRMELSCQGSLIFCGDRLVVPTTLRRRVVQLAHETHQGLVRTKRRLRDRYWWPGASREVDEALRSCQLCAVHSKSAVPCSPPLQAIPLPPGPWQHLECDIIGPLPGPASERFGLVLVDVYSRWPEVAFVSEVKSTQVIEFLEAVFSREGVPSKLQTDNGPQFCSKEFQDWLRSYNITHARSSTYSPQTCGMVERLNRTIKESVATARLMGKPRAAHVRSFLQVYRSTPHSATGISPFEAMRGGRRMRTRVDSSVVPAEHVNDARVRDRVNAYQSRYVNRHNARCRRTLLPTWEVGDLVRVRDPVVKARVYGEVLRVVRRTGPVSYQLSDGQRVHARRLVTARSLPANEDADVLWPVDVGGPSRAETVAVPPARRYPERSRREPDRLTYH